MKAGQRVGRGTVADVFALDDFRVMKIYKVPKDPSHERAYRADFASQVSAYDRISTNALLLRHTPRFFGLVTSTEVIRVLGARRASRYLTDCAYAMERVSGEEGKFGGQFEEPWWPFLEALQREFARVGVLSVGDASVFNYKDPEMLKVIDFGCYEALAWNLPMV